MVSEYPHTYAYIAGMIDQRASMNIYWNKQERRYYAKIEITHENLKLLEWTRDQIQKITSQPGNIRKRQNTWTYTIGARAANKLLQKIDLIVKKDESKIIQEFCSNPMHQDRAECYKKMKKLKKELMRNAKASDHKDEDKKDE